MNAYPKLLFTTVALAIFLGLSGCATTSAPGIGMNQAGANTAAQTPLDQYAMEATTDTQTINLRINPNGFSENQIRALDQLAARTNWISGTPADVQIVTSPTPAAIAAGQAISAYLTRRDVNREHMSQISEESQPGDVITLITFTYQARTLNCNKTWENLAATRNNTPYQNFGCSLTSNLAAQVADPRDLIHPAQAASQDPARKSTILDKYRKGEVTSSAVDTASKGTISDAIQ
jgi:pilus assembly protein CpaD